jgi:hypothetical protein
VEEAQATLKIKYRKDVIFISAVLLLAVTVLLIFTLTKKEGASVIVEIDGTVAGEYPLSVNGEFVLNGGTNVLTIENGTARISDSSCPDHICENKGKIKYVGQTIVCLPNKLTVTVSGVSDDSGVDF